MDAVSSLSALLSYYNCSMVSDLSLLLCPIISAQLSQLCLYCSVSTVLSSSAQWSQLSLYSSVYRSVPLQVFDGFSSVYRSVPL